MNALLYYYEFGLAYVSLMTIADLSEEEFDISDLGQVLITILLASWVWPVFAITDLIGFVYTRIESKKG